MAKTQITSSTGTVVELAGPEVVRVEVCSTEMVAVTYFNRRFAAAEAKRLAALGVQVVDITGNYVLLAAG